jgi:hypothetical protein
MMMFSFLKRCRPLEEKPAMSKPHRARTATERELFGQQADEWH